MDDKYTPVEHRRDVDLSRFDLQTKLSYLPLNEIDSIHPVAPSDSLPVPLYLYKVPAGFPSPADDFIEGQIDLNKHLIKRPASTFIVKVAGDSMTEVGIFPNDWLIVDRSIEAKHGKIVIAVVNGELTVKRLYHRGNDIQLVSENKAYPPIPITGELEIWGVVRHVIHSFEAE